MSLSSEPSIETLPEFNASGMPNGNLLYNINDETIANFCSDTVRELNNLTEELQYSDLDYGRGSAYRPNQYHANDTKRKTNENSIFGDSSYKNDSLHSNNTRTYQEANINNRHNADDAATVVESSPFYTQLNCNNSNNNQQLTNLDNSLYSLTLNNGDSRYNNRRDRLNGDDIDDDTVDGCIRGDRGNLAECMLQSVDLAGKYSVRLKFIWPEVFP